MTYATSTITGTSSLANTRAYAYIFYNRSGSTFRVVGVSGEWQPTSGDVVSRREAEFGLVGGSYTYKSPTSNYFEVIDMTPVEFTPLLDNYELNMSAVVTNNGISRTLRTYASLNGSDLH